jgi:hypothetical protein
MNRRLTLLIAAAVPLAFAAPSFAQDGKTLGVVNNGKTEIVFQAADTSDLPMQQLQAWSQFANEHPNIARELAYHPSLINGDSFTKKHPELGQFFSEHPDIQEAMRENPGNFVAIPPRPGE